MKVIDCFSFFDEFLILDIRLKELYDVVDKFIIIESKQTFTGNDKPLYLQSILDEKYSQYKDKIEIITVEKTSFLNAWDREKYQFNFISKKSLSHLNLKDDDLIILSDVDEIIKRSVIEDMKLNGYNLDGGNFEGPVFYFKFNIMTSEKWEKAKYVSYKNLINFTTHRYETNKNSIKNSMWHFSYLKNIEGVQEKIKAYSHQEFNTKQINNYKNIKDSIDNLRDPFGRNNITLSKVNIDDNYPIYIKENINLLKDWIA